MNSSTMAYCLRGIVQYLDGNTKEFKKYVDIAMEFSNMDRCKYKKNGEWVPALIHWGTGAITDLKGNILREGIKS